MANCNLSPLRLIVARPSQLTETLEAVTRSNRQLSLGESAMEPSRAKRRRCHLCTETITATPHCTSCQEKLVIEDSGDIVCRCTLSRPGCDTSETWRNEDDSRVTIQQLDAWREMDRNGYREPADDHVEDYDLMAKDGELCSR